MARRGENIYKRKDGRWEGRYVRGRRENGATWFGYVYGNRYGEVRERLNRLKLDHARKETDYPRPSRKRLATWLDVWLYERIQPHVRRSTFEGYVRQVERHVKPLLGSLYLHEIGEEHLADFSERLCRKLAQSTARGIQRLLKACLKEAVTAGLLHESPYSRFRMPKAPRRPPRILTQAEQRRLEQAALSGGCIEQILPLYTGLRLGELCALKWSDVDFGARTLRVQRSVQRLSSPQSAGKTALQIGTPKSDSSVRELPLPAFLLALLREKRRKAPADRFIFPGKGGAAMDPRTMQNHFKALAGALNIPNAHVHTLRHTFATRCLEQHIGFEVLSQLLGHSSPRVTMDHYAHATDENMRRSISKLRCFGL